MAQTRLGDLVVNTCAALPSTGKPAPAFTLTDTDLRDKTLSDFAGKKIILNVFPSIDTRVCATSVREFNKRAAALSNTVVLCVSKDLPFAHKRFCGAEGIENVLSLSEFREPSFGSNYGVTLVDGPFQGLHARAVFVIDETGKLVYSELVPAIGQEPDYEKAVSATQGILAV